VETTEMLGAERLIYLRLGDEGLIVRTHADEAPPPIGSTVKVWSRPEQVHRFNADTGQRIDA